MADTLVPFADDARQLTIGDLVVENGTDRIVLHGELEIGRDQRGLQAALALARTAQAIADALEAVGDLPDRLPTAAPSTRTFDNPFEGKA